MLFEALCHQVIAHAYGLHIQAGYITVLHSRQKVLKVCSVLVQTIVHTVLATSYLRFYAESPIRHPGERRMIECGIPLYDHGLLAGYTWTSVQ